MLRRACRASAVAYGREALRRGAHALWQWCAGDMRASFIAVGAEDDARRAIARALAKHMPDMMAREYYIARLRVTQQRCDVARATS